MKKHLISVLMGVSFIAACVVSAVKDGFTSREYYHEEKAFFWLPIAAAAAGAMGGALGSAGKNRAISRKQQGINKMKAENENWYNRRYNEDATQRADAQRLLSMTEDAIKRRNRAAEGRRAMMGGTDESVAAEKERNNKVVADVTSQIAAAGERRKDQIEQQYLNRKNNLEAQYYDLEGEKATGYDIAGNMIAGIANSGTLSNLGGKKS